MFKAFLSATILIGSIGFGFAQEVIPLDTVHWDIQARAYVLEPYQGKDAIYLHRGSITLKDVSFLNGTIEYDIYLTGTRGFPGVSFRINDSDAELFYIRPHQSGNPDANQTAGITKGVTPWQFYFGPKYSFPYTYGFNKWTHVKIVVQGERAQVYLDNAEKPNLSWRLFHSQKAGGIRLSGGLVSGVHLANIRVNTTEPNITDFNPIARKPIEGLIPQWEVSDKFEEKQLENIKSLSSLIGAREWGKTISVEEGIGANISRQVELNDGKPGNTVFAKLVINSNREQTRLFEFGYSDRVVVILNGKPIYKGTNRFQSRDYRYLGTLGLFDGIYLNLKRGENTLLLAISEDFGGWLVTGKFPDPNGLKIK